MSASLPPAFSKFHISNFSSTEFSFAKNSSFKPQIPKRSFRISGNSDKLDTPALLDEAPKDVQVVSGDVVAKEERENEGGSKISAAAASAAIEKDLKNVSTPTVHASIGTLIETMAEELTIEELMALKASIARLSKEMQEVTATIRRNTARIAALYFHNKQTQHSIVVLLPSLNNSERNPSLPAKSKEFKELEAAVQQHTSVETQLLQFVNPPILLPITAFSTSSTTMPLLQTQILPLIPHTSLDPEIAKSPFTTTLQNSLTPHSLSPDLPMENLNPAIMASHGEHGLCSNCETFHRTFHGSVQNLVPFTDTDLSDNESPIDPFSETVPQHISTSFVSRNLSEVPLTISLHALEGHLVSFTLRLQELITGHSVVRPVDVLDEGLASPDEDYWVFYAERSSWWSVIKAGGAPKHGAKLYDNTAVENLLKSIESISRFRTSQFDTVKVGGLIATFYHTFFLFNLEDNILLMKKVVNKTASTFAPRASTATKNPAVPGTALYTIFEIQGYASMLLGGALSFNIIFPSNEPDIWRLMGMWSIWMFTIPSLRARDCSKKEKEALNYLFLLIPLLNVIIPFFWKSFAVVWSADTIAFFLMYAWKLGLLQKTD